MTVALNDGTVTRNVTGISLRTGAGLKTVTEVWLRIDKSTIKQVFALLGVTLSSYSVVGTGNSAGTATVTSAAVTATPTGAIGTVSHAWTRTAPDAHAWTIDEPTSATTTFTTTAAENVQWVATFIDTITDSAGQVIASNAVTVTCSNIYYGGGYQGGGGFGGGQVYR